MIGPKGVFLRSIVRLFRISLQQKRFLSKRSKEYAIFLRHFAGTLKPGLFSEIRNNHT